MKYVKITLIVLIALLVTGVVSYWIFFSNAVPDYSGTLNLKGLTSRVEVRYDDHGIPHIYAQNNHDLFFAQGYVLARDRMFQLELTRLAGRGELSSLFGEATLDKDRFLKTVGFHRLAQKGYDAMSPQAREYLQAYVSGINTCIQTTGSLSREFTILGAEPGQWQPQDCVATVLLMAYSLTRSKLVDLVLYQVGEEAGEDFLKMITPSYPDFAPTLTGQRLSPVPRGILRGIFHRFSQAGKASLLATPLDMELPASNWMIFSGKVTTTGKVLFAGSPDLKPTLPALFYVMHLEGGDYNVAGGALPGTPGIGPLGYNGHIAWSAVNGRGDELDYYVEKIHPENENKYLTETGYRNFIIINETLKVKTGDGIQEIPFPVKVSRHGPIISGVMPLAPANCAMKWAAFERPCTDPEGLLYLNRAKNFSQFRAALRSVATNNLGIGYGDNKGNIGWQFTASAPVRMQGDGTYPVPGWTGTYEWKGFVPDEKLPYDYNPPEGYVASFNNDPGNVSYHLTNFYLFERAIRFEQIMRQQLKDGNVSPDDVRDMQLDKVSVVAKRWVPHIIKACDGDESKDAMEQLRQWDFSIDRESVAATIFNAFYAGILKNTFRDNVGDKLWEEGLSQSYLYYVPDLVMARIHDNPEHVLYDDIKTSAKKETRDDIIRKSMKEALAELQDMFGDDIASWKWGRGHRMYFEHPLGSKLSFFNLDPIPTHGSHHTINSGFWSLAEPFKMDSGGVIRITVDFANPENTTIISPPGQSGVYMSPYYDDLAELWADGGQVPLHFTSGKELENVLILNPGGK